MNGINDPKVAAITAELKDGIWRISYLIERKITSAETVGSEQSFVYWSVCFTSLRLPFRATIKAIEKQFGNWLGMKLVHSQ